MTPATTWPRTVAAVGIIVTLVLQLADTIGVAQDAGLDGAAVTTAVINWFSFFTTLSARPVGDDTDQCGGLHAGRRRRLLHSARWTH